MPLLPFNTTPKTEYELQRTLGRIQQNIEFTVWARADVSANVGQGKVVYVNSSGQYVLAQANALSSSDWIGVTALSGSSGQSVPAAISGIAEIVGGTLTPGTKYYLSPTTAGELTATVPTTAGQVIVPIGTAITATEIRLSKERTILL